MIHSVTCKNFYSFHDEVTFSFAVNEHAPHNASYTKGKTGTKLSKVETVIGPNAAGKTNLLKALPFMRWLIVDSFNANPSDPLLVRTSLPGDEEVAELAVDFEIKNRLYHYSFLMTRQRIIMEELQLTTYAKQNKSRKTLFWREWDATSGSYKFTARNFDLPKGIDKKSLLRTNSSVVSAAMRFSHKESELIAEYWTKLITNVTEWGYAGNRDHEIFMAQACSLYYTFPEIKEEAAKLLARFDLGIKSFEVQKGKTSIENNEFDIKFIHQVGGKEVELPFRYESSGTQQLFVLLTFVLWGLAHGGLVILDEIDANLHPSMTAEIVQLFMDTTTNDKNAQILFSTQNHLILNKLDKYQIYLVEKGPDGFSEGWRLDEISGVRSDENYAAKYIAGAYGASPRI